MKLTRGALRQIITEEVSRVRRQRLTEAARAQLAMAWATESSGEFNLVMSNVDRMTFDSVIERLAYRLSHYGDVNVDEESMTLSLSNWSASPEDIEGLVNEAEKVLGEVLEAAGYDTFYGQRGLPANADFGVSVRGTKKRQGRR